MSDVSFNPQGSEVVKLQEWTQHHDKLNRVFSSLLDPSPTAPYRNPALPLGGNSVLTAGRVTIKNAYVKKTSLINVFGLNAGSNQGSLYPENVKEGLSFDIVSTNNLDDRQVGWSFFSPGV